MLEVEPTDQRGRSAAESGRRGRAHIVSPLSVRYLVALSAVIKHSLCAYSRRRRHKELTFSQNNLRHIS